MTEKQLLEWKGRKEEEESEKVIDQTCVGGEEEKLNEKNKKR